jgi:hypothetical protein
MVPTRSLEEKTLIWFRAREAIYLPARLAFTFKSETLQSN